MSLIILFFSEDVVVAVSLSGMLNIWMLKSTVDSKVQSLYSIIWCNIFFTSYLQLIYVSTN